VDSVALAPVMPTAAVLAPATAPTLVLTQALGEGDEAAWRDFHAAYAPRLMRYLLVVCQGREEQAREALQQTFIRAVRHIRPCHTEAELWGWLTLLARCAAADLGRLERRYLGFLTRWLPHQTDPLPAPPEADQRLQEALAAELAALSPADRELLEQKYFGDNAVRELAETLGTSEKAVESRLTRARQRLKTAILNRLRHET
jgi:RNA polymerase sigma-70 factor (ECF subfamily)